MVVLASVVVANHIGLDFDQIACKIVHHRARGIVLEGIGQRQKIANLDFVHPHLRPGVLYQQCTFERRQALLGGLRQLAQVFCVVAGAVIPARAGIGVNRTAARQFHRLRLRA